MLDPLIVAVLPIFEELLFVGKSLEEPHPDGLHFGVEADGLSEVGGEFFVNLPTLPFLELRMLFLEDIPDILIDGDEEVGAIVVFEGTGVDTGEVESRSPHILCFIMKQFNYLIKIKLKRKELDLQENHILALREA